MEIIYTTWQGFIGFTFHILLIAVMASAVGISWINCVKDR